VKKGDMVQMLSGKDRGKRGRVIDARPREGKVIVENMNVAKRHTKPQPVRDSSRMGGGGGMTPGGIIEHAGGCARGQRDGRLPDVRPADPDRVRAEGIEGRDREGPRLQARRLRPGDRSLMPPVAKSPAKKPAAKKAAAKTTEYVPRMKLRYNDELRAELKDQLGLSSIMQSPTISKITLNMGVGEAKTDAKLLDQAIEELTIIAGQRAQVRKARKSVAQFKLREGMPIGARVTLRGDRMWEFLDRLVSIALPRIRDFSGLNQKSFDGRGNYSLGLREQIIFPEIDYDNQGDPRPRRCNHDHCQDGRAGGGALARPRIAARREAESE
jgi:large subunit ribosomal protein L5